MKSVDLDGQPTIYFLKSKDNIKKRINFIRKRFRRQKLKDSKNISNNGEIEENKVNVGQKSRL